MNIRGIKTFCRTHGIALMVLFGSSAGTKEGSANDLDIAVKFKHGKEVSKLKLIYKLDDLFYGIKIDLVLLTADTSPLLLHEIYQKGECLFEFKKDIFLMEKLRAWKLYLDTEKILSMRTKYLKDFAKKVSHVA
jgi:predicted nucleotidyltransferase